MVRRRRVRFGRNKKRRSGRGVHRRRRRRGGRGRRRAISAAAGVTPQNLFPYGVATSLLP